MHLTNSKRYILWIVSVWGYIFSLINILEKSFIEEDFSIFGRHYAKTWKELKFSNCSYLRIKDTSLFRNGLKLSLKEFLSYYFCQRAIFSKSWTQLILNRSIRDKAETWALCFFDKLFLKRPLAKANYILNKT